MSPRPGNNKREEKKIPTKISNVIESVIVCDSSGQSICRLRFAVATDSGVTD